MPGARLVPGAPSLPGAPSRAVGTRRGAFRVTERGVVWRCPRCENEHPLEVQTCTVCGTSFAEAVKGPESERPARDAGTAALISLFLPGAGHGYLGLWGQAIARAVISIWVVFTALLGGVQRSIPLVVVFGIAAVGLWVVAAHDAYQEAQGAPSAAILKGKAFMYVVFGLLGLLFVMLVVTAFQARGA